MSSFEPLTDPDERTNNLLAITVPVQSQQSQDEALDDLCKPPVLTPAKLAELQKAVGAFPPEICTKRDEWLKVGAGFHTEAARNPEYATRLFEIFDAWSRQAPNYEEGCVGILWDSFDDNRKGATADADSIFNMAEKYGYSPAPFPVDDPDALPFGVITLGDLYTRDLTIEYLVDDLLVWGHDTVIGAVPKCLKTSLMVDLAVSLASGKDFLNHFHIPQTRKSIYLSAESGFDTLKNIVGRVCASRDILPKSIYDQIHMGDRVPLVDNPKQLTLLESLMQKVKPSVLFVDPLYKSLQLGSEASNLMVVGDKLQKLSLLCREQGVMLICCHHVKKSSATKKELDLLDLTQAGIAEHFRQFAMLRREKPFQFDGVHDLKMSVSASVGVYGQYSLHVREGAYNGAGEHKWDVQIQTTGEKEAEEAEVSQLLITEDTHVVMSLMRELGPVTSKAALHIPAKVKGVSRQRCDKAFASLRGNGQIVRDLVDSTISSKKYHFKIREDDQ